MTLDELELVCRSAAADLVQREGRPVPTAVVLPLPQAVRVTTFPDFPDDDPTRFDLLARFAADVASPANAAAWGFVAEALSQDGDEILAVVFGARRQHPRVTGAPLLEGTRGLGDFVESEEFEPAALPFLSPLQQAVDAAAPPSAMSLQ